MKKMFYGRLGLDVFFPFNTGYLLINVSNIPTKLLVKKKLWCLYFKLHVQVFCAVKKKEKLNIPIGHKFKFDP